MKAIICTAVMIQLESVTGLQNVHKVTCEKFGSPGLTPRSLLAAPASCTAVTDTALVSIRVYAYPSVSRSTA